MDDFEAFGPHEKWNDLDVYIYISMISNYYISHIYIYIKNIYIFEWFDGFFLPSCLSPPLLQMTLHHLTGFKFMPPLCRSFAKEL